MLKNYVEELVLKEFVFEPTVGQRSVIDSLAAIVTDERPFYILKIHGFAGTGKTSLVAAFVKVLLGMQQKVELLGPTGRAAKVLSSYSGELALTIHKKIYRQKTADDFISKFSLDRNLANDTIFIVDEASMIADSSRESNTFGSGNLLEDLITYVKAGRNCKLILLGDSANCLRLGARIARRSTVKRSATTPMWRRSGSARWFARIRHRVFWRMLRLSGR